MKAARQDLPRSYGREKTLLCMVAAVVCLFAFAAAPDTACAQYRPSTSQLSQANRPTVPKAENNRDVQLHQIRRGVRAYLQHKVTGDLASASIAAKDFRMPVDTVRTAANPQLNQPTQRRIGVGAGSALDLPTQQRIGVGRVSGPSSQPRPQAGPGSSQGCQ